MPPKTVPTRILILSDTHALTFPNTSTPFSHPPPPKVDLLIHCGDLTRAKHQTRNAYTGALDLLAAFPATLKLVIAGNHDIALDPIEWAARGGRAEFHEEMVALMTGEEAKKAGVVFLNEGVYTFDLENGARLKVYATPYTPLYSDSAFKYPPNSDRFNLPQHIPANLTTGKHPTVSIAQNPVPGWPDVDIMMTHGPPLEVLDMSKKEKRAGCADLRRAVERCRPMVHCFGHVHEGYGGQVVEWETGGLRALHREGGEEDDDELGGGKGETKGKKSGRIGKSTNGSGNDNERANPYPAPANIGRETVFGKETIMINAAIRGRSFGGLWEENKYPWVLEVELPVAERAGGEVIGEGEGDGQRLEGLEIEK